MSDQPAMQRVRAIFAHPVTGSTLTVLSGLSFLLVCMLLPMVGLAGAATPHAAHNHQVFSTILLMTLALSGFAIASKVARRRRDQSPPPWFSMALGVVLALLWIALHAGLLRI
jgi:predicted transporter